MVWIRLLMVVAAFAVPPAWSATQDKPLPVLHFLVAFNEGADCPRLFELRNDAKRQGEKFV